MKGKPIEGLRLEDFDYSEHILFDDESYHLDYQIVECKDLGNGYYDIPEIILGRSDKLSSDKN